MCVCEREREREGERERKREERDGRDRLDRTGQDRTDHVEEKTTKLCDAVTTLCHLMRSSHRHSIVPEEGQTPRHATPQGECRTGTQSVHQVTSSFPLSLSLSLPSLPPPLSTSLHVRKTPRSAHHPADPRAPFSPAPSPPAASCGCWHTLWRRWSRCRDW